MKILAVARATLSAGLIVLIFLALVLALPRVSPPGATNPSRSTPTPAATMAPTAESGCSGTGLSTELLGDGPEPTIASRSQRAAVLIGRVEEMGTARWNTDSGERPEGTRWPRNGMIYRPVTIAVDRLVKGSVSIPTLTIWHLGGTVGCDHFSVAGQTDLEVGSEYALFLDLALGISGQRVTQLFDGDAWPLGENGKVQSPLEGDFSVDSFVEAVKAVP